MGYLPVSYLPRPDPFTPRWRVVFNRLPIVVNGAFHQIDMGVFEGTIVPLIFKGLAHVRRMILQPHGDSLTGTP
jgi:hypothetical protein